METDEYSLLKVHKQGRVFSNEYSYFILGLGLGLTLTLTLTLTLNPNPKVKVKNGKQKVINMNGGPDANGTLKYNKAISGAETHLQEKIVI